MLLNVQGLHSELSWLVGKAPDLLFTPGPSDCSAVPLGPPGLEGVRPRMPNLLALGKRPRKLCSSLAQATPTALHLFSAFGLHRRPSTLDSSSSPQIARAPCSVHMDLVARVAANRALVSFWRCKWY